MSWQVFCYTKEMELEIKNKTIQKKVEIKIPFCLIIQRHTSKQFTTK